MLPQELVVTAVVVVSQPNEGDPQADDQSCQEGNQGHHQGGVNVPEAHKLHIARLIQIRIGLVPYTDPDGCEAEPDQSSGTNNGATKCSHREVLQRKRFQPLFECNGCLARLFPGRRAVGRYWPNMRRQPPKTSKIPARTMKILLQPQEG
jgi:hypothetical protein